MAVKHTSEIKFNIGLDENKIPETISWSAEDGGIDNSDSKAIMISVWDHKKRILYEWIFGQKICRLMK